MKSEEKNYLTEFSNVYDHPAIVLWKAVEAKHISKVLSTIGLEKPILDLGCGEGKVSSIIFDDIIDVGLDIKVSEIGRSKLTGTYSRLVVGDGSNLPFRRETFGLVFSNCVIEHIPDIENVLTGVSRVLKTGGYFIFTVPGEKFGEYLFFTVLFKKLGLKKLANWYSVKRNKYLNHYNIFHADVWARKLKDVGLEVIVSQQYLSKTSLKTWDLLAFFGFFWRKLQLDKLQILVNWLPGFDRMRIKTCTGALFRYYVDESKDGGGLVIVTQRRDENE